MTITVYGASDDLIEVEGAIREEFNALSEDDGSLLAFSNGVVLRVVYGDAGVWRITPVCGASRVNITLAPEDDEDNYSDRAVMEDDAAWVVFGKDIAKAPR